MFDTHVHTKYSADSEMELSQALIEAKKQNLGLIITEHIDVDCPNEKFRMIDLHSYFKEYEEYRGHNVLLGIEMGMKIDKVEEINKILVDNPFDYVIGSVHIVDYIDIFQHTFYEGRSKDETYKQYLDYMIHCLKTHDNIDSLGHIDYISRYSPYEDKEIYYEDYSDYIDEALKILAFKEKAMEINSRRLKDANTVKNLMTIYKRFYELGGRFVTLGSDAHTPEAVGKNLYKAKEIAEECNLKPVYFKDRKMLYMK